MTDLDRTAERESYPPPIVMKFGGAALATPSKVERAAEKILKKTRTHAVIVVVSAMGDETDRLLALTQCFSPAPQGAAVDTVLAAGEQIAAGLMVLALMRVNLKAEAYMAYQLPILTDGCFGDGRILRIETLGLRNTLKSGVIPVVAGFQGIDANQRLVTLGRGGSDTSAVAIAAALGAEFCELYKDVDGVYSEDPRRVPTARRYSRLTYEAMEQIAEREPQILHHKAVQLAKLHQVRLHIRTAFADVPGTVIESINANRQVEEVSA